MSPAPGAVPDDLRDPWERWGVLYAGVWLAFLAFPVVAAATMDAPAWRITLALALIGAFAVLYVAAWLLAGGDATGTTRRTPWFVAGLLALWAGVTALVGDSTIGMLIFVVVLLCLLGTSRQVGVGIPTVLAAAVVAAWTTNGLGALFELGLLGLMTVVSLLLRAMEQRRETFQGLQEQMAVAGERDRVARDVHDVLGHSLTVMITKAELAERLVERDPDGAVAELRSIQSLGREALTEIRATVSGLRVARLSDELAGAAEALRSAGIVAEVPDDPQVVDPRRRLVLAWVLREAVTNVVRHSDAAHCRVELGAHSLVVSDDGRGAGGAVAGNGLRGVEERVRAAGGTLTLESLTPGDTAPGTRLEVAWP